MPDGTAIVLHYSRLTIVAGEGTYARAVVLIVVLLSGGAGIDQAGQPEWTEDFYVELKGWAEEYNSQVETDSVGFPGSGLVRDERVNLYVKASDGSEAVYSFRTDERLRIRDLERGKRDDVTLRVATTKATLERVANEEDSAAALRRAILIRDIRIQRVLRLPSGSVIAIGSPEVIIGSLALVATAFALTKAWSGAVWILRALPARLTAAVRWAIGVTEGVLGDLFAALSVLDLFGVVNVGERCRTLWRWLTVRANDAWNWLRQQLARNGDAESRDRES